MVSLCLKNKGSAVRFCLWPQVNFSIYLRTPTKLRQKINILKFLVTNKNVYILFTNLYSEIFKVFTFILFFKIVAYEFINIFSIASRPFLSTL